MPIEFKCSNCQNVLKVGDEHAGKSARCPSCKTVVSIPASSPEPAEAPSSVFPDAPTTDSSNNPFAGAAPSDGGGGGPFAGAANPYQTPKSTKLESRPIAGGTMAPRAASFEEIFSLSWKLFTQNLGLLVGTSVVVLMIGIAINLGAQFMQAMMIEMNFDPFALFAFSMMYSLGTGIIQTFFYIGQAKICLKLARGQHAEFSELFSGANKLLPVYIAGIIVGIIIGVGILLLIIPGIIAALMLWPYFYVITDDKGGIGDFLGLAYRIGTPNILTSLVLAVVTLALVVAGMLAVCVGIVFSVGLIAMMYSVAYLKMSGQLR